MYESSGFNCWRMELRNEDHQDPGRIRAYIDGLRNCVTRPDAIDGGAARIRGIISLIEGIGFCRRILNGTCTISRPSLFGG